MSGRLPLLDVPLLPDPDYVRFLAEHARALASVHFGLGGALGDGRQRTCRVEADRLAELLRELPGMRRHALLNARFQHPAAYAGPALSGTLAVLERLLAAGVLDGIVLTDAYLMQALSDASPQIAAALEALPGVNCGIADARDATAWLEAVAATRFRQPSRIVAERRLNRDPAGLARLREGLAAEWPDLRVALLANEGCLPACPYRHAHDALIAFGHACGDAGGFARNAELGCARRFLARPGLLLASPFIRPEDAGRYAGTADILKLCGRTRGAPVMQGIVQAYLRGRFAGNLLEILDAQEGLSTVAALDNAKLPPEFHDIVTRCGGHCVKCRACDTLSARAFRRLTPSLRRLAGA